MNAVPRASRRVAVARQRGFTLLEVLLAFALLAGASVLLLSILSNGLRDVADAERHGEAALHARSLMDNFGRMERLRPGGRNGSLDDGRYRWALEVQRVQDPLPAPLPTPGQATSGPGADGIVDAGEPVLYRLDLTLQWGEGGPKQTFRTSTLRALYPLPEDL
ncbi:prepilin-type N-terminal cleavage/methylation domain-containing protein [Silanimonas sp.]|uniref:prepilin-type N-terminal cleavage/methylation domain-containing protein n=1 Tax=Silanimonas sp. TaxID=1929290 RepID=UPI0022C3E96E|nr:prepilin-type N-terminal cleavage/methylation domain-containing protein [Silanimonas sp.]MCZ8164357.1 prepilin-type N-terminal cleavage/methylation domain-containing protein [Silanimonas sp.]